MFIHLEENKSIDLILSMYIFHFQKVKLFYMHCIL